MGMSGPDLLAVDDESIALKVGAGLDRGEVGTGTRLRHTFAPDFLRLQNLVEVARLLFRGAPLHQGGTGHDDAEHVDSHRKVKPCQFLAEDHLLDKGCAAPAILFGPAYSRPSAFIKFPMPGLAPLPQQVVGELLLLLAAECRRLIGFQPGPDLFAKGFLFGRIAEVHEGAPWSNRRLAADRRLISDTNRHRKEARRVTGETPKRA